MICAAYDLIHCTIPGPEPDQLLNAMRIAVTRLGATVLGEFSVPFQPHGATCVVVLAESHLIQFAGIGMIEGGGDESQ